nr:gap junction delta-4 protein [Pelodiscus sinensis]XP_006133087.1 gap junction delta-4 protein [Pelodiscus sinensis]XP_006133088.1 gap junction delta-4 protein [Pelodiscus sinensis]XP_006133089.1 gap junction delta-4 protein [Pelodiscus sinensis]|eukprot:XP_006133086.1 gap junction delta-4 protein [Pelodiscus sinensis]
MERWDSLGFLIITLNYNVTMAGKMWLTLVILLRMLVIVLAGYPLYQDEQERFICNTLQPGCSNVCYDIFSPVSHFRFWLIQTVSVLLPYTVFSVYVLHKVAMHVVTAHCSPCRDVGIKTSGGHAALNEPCKYTSVTSPACTTDHLSIPDFSRAYTVHLFLRTLAEAGFGAGQYYLFGFFVPKRFSCYQSPCTSTVDCYISRPTEKSIMMIFIWGVSGLSFLLSLIDLAFAIQRMAVRNGQKKLTESLHAEDEHNSDLPLAGRLKDSPPSPEDRGHLVIHDGHTNEVSCSLHSEDEEELQVEEKIISQQTALSNLNSNSNKPCITKNIAVNQGSNEASQCISDQQGIPNRQTRNGQQQAFTKEAQVKSHLGVYSSVSQSKLLGHYSSAELRASDGQSSCNSAGYLRSKKSEWV